LQIVGGVLAMDSFMVLNMLLILIDHAMSGCVDELLSLHAIGTWS